MTADDPAEQHKGARPPDLKRVFAAAISLPVPGSGHLLYGHVRRGIVWAALRILFSLSIPLTMGRAEFLYWSWDAGRVSPRLDRIGRLLRADRS